MFEVGVLTRYFVLLDEWIVVLLECRSSPHYLYTGMETFGSREPLGHSSLRQVKKRLLLGIRYWRSGHWLVVRWGLGDKPHSLVSRRRHFLVPCTQPTQILSMMTSMMSKVSFRISRYCCGDSHSIDLAFAHVVQFDGRSRSWLHTFD